MFLNFIFGCPGACENRGDLIGQIEYLVTVSAVSTFLTCCGTQIAMTNV
jgi:hypothetical protein